VTSYAFLLFVLDAPPFATFKFDHALGYFTFRRLLIALAAAFCFGVSFAIWRLHQMLRVRYYVTIALEEWPILALQVSNAKNCAPCLEINLKIIQIEGCN